MHRARQDSAELLQLLVGQLTFARGNPMDVAELARQPLGVEAGIIERNGDDKAVALVELVGTLQRPVPFFAEKARLVRLRVPRDQRHKIAASFNAARDLAGIIIARLKLLSVEP